MPSNEKKGKTPVIKNNKHICSKCGFDNQNFAVYCEICFYPLSNTKLDKPEFTTENSSVVKPQRAKDSSKHSRDFRQELKKPSVISGLGVLALAIALWINYFISLQPRYIGSSRTGDKLALYDSMSQVKDVPSGLYSYGGALYFASLVAHGMNSAMLQEHPYFDLRYTKARNNDQSYHNGIQMLLDGELSFAFNGRSLTDEEYSQANLRDIRLQQIPIAIDGTVFFGNSQNSVKGLSLAQAKDIFAGKITNWKQLGGRDLPITPVLLNPENIETLNLNNPDIIPKKTQYVSNYTLALRKVIATPGAISFASSSLAQKQQLIKVFGLAEDNSASYIKPLIAGKPNLAEFKSGQYPLTRRLFLVVRQDGTPDQSAGKAYAQMLLSGQGQAIVESAGFVPLYSRQ